jgi:hypothetical protein
LRNCDARRFGGVHYSRVCLAMTVLPNHSREA